MWRAIVFGCVLTLATATAGEHSPGNDLNNDGGPQDRRVWRERHWQERREDCSPCPATSRDTSSRPAQVCSP
jgi:hypothetical protein